MLTKKQFDAKRLALIDRLRRDGGKVGKSPSARLVGTEILACVNYVTGDAWPGGPYLARKLGLCLCTVRRAIADLIVNEDTPQNYLHVTRTGRSNRYRPNFALLDEKLLPLDADTVADATSDKNDSNRGHFCSSTGDKNVPLSLIQNPITSLRRAASSDSERLRDSRGDEKAEVEAARLFGDDGYSILSSLHEIDQGQPRLRLLALVRGGRVTDNDLEVARLAAWTASSKRKGSA
jgi:hypothetical protein